MDVRISAARCSTCRQARPAAAALRWPFGRVRVSVGCDMAALRRPSVRSMHASETLDEPLLTAREVSELLGGIPSKTVLQYARDGRLPCLRIGKHVWFLRSDIARVLDAQ